MASEFRTLTAEEISALVKQGCSCDDWSGVCVADGFDAGRISTTRFSGNIRLGVFNKEVSFFGGLKKPTGISDAAIHNCTIGDNVYINRVKSYIANYIIEDEVVIENVDLLAVEGASSFGNGTEVVALNEAGGREIPIYDRLSAHTAYIIALYRHRPKTVEKLRKMIADYTASVTSSTGLVGRRTKLINCRIIKNVKTGPDSVLEGVERLKNGSVNSSCGDPVYIGPGVIAEDFIVCSGARITDGVIMSGCFVGQGCVLAKHYSAQNSVFFANCGGFHGEASSIFAGPYTVTYHKSTLLIAGYFSFLNAGSGSNQSNHLYKLGPVHQGVVERGSKTGSDSYILWPARVGAFTVVMGRHYKNCDTSDLPFSYLIEHEDESILVPGVNLRSVGTIRDARKWPRRDRRKDPEKLDYINFKLLSPYTVGKMLKGREVLAELKATTAGTTDYYRYHNARIKSSSLDKGLGYYQMGIDKFLGNCLIKQLENKQPGSVEELGEALLPQSNIGVDKWVDLAGLFAPEEVVQKLLSDIEDETVGTPDLVKDTFLSMYDNYPRYEWAWAVGVIQRQLGKTIEQVTPDDIIELTKKWKTAVLKLDELLLEDAKKEFVAASQIGFGIDGADDVRQLDFEAVRGKFEENSFVAEIEKHIRAKTRLGDELISRMEKLR